MRILFGLVLVIGVPGFLAGCATTGGPFVTNVSSGGPGKLVVEKCKLSQNLWTGGMELEECQNHEIAIQP